MRCPFCYSVTAREGTTEQDQSVLRAFVDRNHVYIDSINYGTGENTLSKNWFALLKYVRSSYPDVGQALTTNGYLGPALQQRPDADAILAALDEVDISLDYADPIEHARGRGHPDAYQWARATIDVCRSAGIPTTLVVLGIDQTLARDNLAPIFELALQHGSFVRINIFRPNHGQACAALSYVVLKQALRFIVETQTIVSLSDPLFSALIAGERAPDGSGRTSLRILPDGSITPSTYLVTDRWKRAHIQDADLDDPKLRAGLSLDISSEIIPKACAACRYVELCRGGAIDRRIIWHGTLERRDPYCPLENDDSLDSWRSFGTIQQVNGPHIHDGYLPTLIFGPSGLP